MARKVAGNTNVSKKTSKPKRTSIGRGFHSKCMMNKQKEEVSKNIEVKVDKCQPFADKVILYQLATVV
jgi:hypothetical protein